MLSIVILTIIIIGAFILFLTDKVSVDLVAMLVLGALLIFGLVTPQEAVSGFSNTATVTVGAMFILSAGLIRTGVINYITFVAEKSFTSGSTTIMLFLLFVAGGLSAFVNNTAVVAVFLPVVLRITKKSGLSPSKFLIPLSYAAILGGSCTLLGTSTNILVSSIAARHGLGEFGIFEFTKLGIVLFAAGGLFLVFFGFRMLPHRASTGDLTRKYLMRRYLTEVTVPADSPMVGKTLTDRGINEKYGVNILEIIRKKTKIWKQLRSTMVEAEDVLLVRGSVQDIMNMTEGEGLLTLGDVKLGDEDLQAEDLILVEGVIAPNSRLIGHNIREINFRQRYGAFVLAIQSHGRTMRSKIVDISLHLGDSLLIQGSAGTLRSLQDNQDFLMMEEVKVEKFKRDRAMIATAIIVAVVALAAFNVFPIMVSAIIGAILMVATGCLTIKDAYDNVDWMVIFLLAGMIPLGIALEKTGAAGAAANWFVRLFDSFGTFGVLSALYIATALLTSVLTNNATAVLLAPIAISMALSLGMNPKPFLFVVMFAASASFITPIGYQTNTLVYGPGRYRFFDYFKIGAPINLIAWLVVTLLVPIFWPLR